MAMVKSVMRKIPTWHGWSTVNTVWSKDFLVIASKFYNGSSKRAANNQKARKTVVYLTMDFVLSSLGEAMDMIDLVWIRDNYY